MRQDVSGLDDLRKNTIEYYLREDFGIGVQMTLMKVIDFEY